jgi:acyl-CoA hydrolase
VVTKHVSEINFKFYRGDIVEIGIDVVRIWHKFLTLKCEARNMTRETIIVTIDSTTMDNLGQTEKTKPAWKNRNRIC